MVKIFIIILALVAVILGGSAASMLPFAGKKNMLFTTIVQLFTFGTITCIAYIFAIAAGTANMAEWAYAVYFASIDWLLASMLAFSRQYTKIWQSESVAPLAFFLIAVLDNASLLVNFKFHHAFSVELRYLSDGSTCFMTVFNDYYYVHLIICYILVAVILIMFFAKTIMTKGYMRARYLTVLVIFLCIIIINGIFIIFNFTLDVSVCIYATAALIIGYFSKSVNPKTITESMLSAIAEKIECALVGFDENDECVYYNQLAARIFGQSNCSKILENTFKKWRNGRETNTIENCNWNDIYELNGEDCHFDIHFTKIYDKKGHFSGSYISMYDITSDYVAYEEEKYRSSHDNLTGALNRESFYEEVRKMLELYPTTDYVMICSNIKGFKLINDMFGLDVADKVLVKIADGIRSRLQNGATYARLEADRFALLLPKERYSEEVLKKAMREVEYIINNTHYRMNIHVGVYDIYDRSATVASMCDRAFLAIDSIKDRYSTTIAYYGDTLRNEYMNEQKIIGEFETALTNGQFAVFIQPIVDRGGVTKFGEALVRWVHPEKGIIAPGGFVDILERTGYIYKLDLFVWEQAIKRLAYWNAAGHPDMSLSINISVKDFYYVDIYETLINMVEKYHINPNQLKLEITESVFMAEKERLIDIIYALSDYGFTVEIDDFGSGFSSLNMLKEVPAKVLKIDMNFLSGNEKDSRGRKIIESVIGLANAIDMDVIVEGVETEEQVVFLREFGADYFQGYYFDKPMPIKSFEEKYVIQ